MCEITNITKLNNNILLSCSVYEGDFMNSSLLKIFDKKNNIFETKNFMLDKTRPCFNSPVTPWIMLKEDIPDSFLDKGNKIEFA